MGEHAGESADEPADEFAAESTDEPARATVSDGSETGDARHAGSAQTGEPAAITPPEQFDWRGWLLVGVVVCSTLVVPALVLFLPQMESLVSGLGLSMRQAYLALPMVPAILLGVTAVWVTLRSYEW